MAVGGFTDQLLKPDVPEDKKRRNLAIIRDEVRRLEDIIYQMGHFLKVSLKEPVYFDPAPALAAVVDSPEVRAKGRGYEIGLRVDPCPPEILCDPTSFGEVVRNLLDNAFDATPAGGAVTIRGYRKNRSGYVVSVRDAGRGISNPDKDQLFRPFFTTKEKGMGLGLPFIKRVMDTCGGKVDVQSRVGKGTIFRLTFNYRDKEPQP
ncbi:MAG: HAMP domain-containing histidine kinase [Acidobacteria bacterium]|nr:HAMP domain-containing histidine kinase [Acidobacteriota bacterium]